MNFLLLNIPLHRSKLKIATVRFHDQAFNVRRDVVNYLSILIVPIVLFVSMSGGGYYFLTRLCSVAFCHRCHLGFAGWDILGIPPHCIRERISQMSRRTWPTANIRVARNIPLKRVILRGKTVDYFVNRQTRTRGFPLVS